MGADTSDSRSGVVDENGVVRIGSVVFAMIRPTPGREVAFNRWYERDHYYTAGTAAAGVFSAGRFIHPETGWHLALYFVLPGHDAARLGFATEQVTAAAAEDRMFADREHLHTWSYEVESTVVGADGVPLALALDHRYEALRVALVDGGPPPETGPSLALRPISPIMPSKWEGEIDLARRRIILEFGPGSPGHDHAFWSGTFIPVVFGTDTHIADGR